MSDTRLPLRKSVEHELKCWPAYFGDVLSGIKPFEVRRDDREPFFRPGDYLLLKEYNPHTGYTGRFLRRRVTYVLPGGEFGIEDGYCVMGLSEEVADDDD